MLCPNSQHVVLTEADEAVLQAVEDELLDPIVVTDALSQAAAVIVESPAAVPERRDALEARLAEITMSIYRRTAAIGAGGELPLLAKLKVCEADRVRVEAERNELEAINRLIGRDLHRIERELRGRVDDMAQGGEAEYFARTPSAPQTARGNAPALAAAGGRDVKVVRREHYGKLFSGIVATAGTSPTGDLPEWTREIPGEVPAVGAGQAA